MRVRAARAASASSASSSVLVLLVLQAPSSSGPCFGRLMPGPLVLAVAAVLSSACRPLRLLACAATGGRSPLHGLLAASGSSGSLSRQSLQPRASCRHACTAVCLSLGFTKLPPQNFLCRKFFVPYFKPCCSGARTKSGTLRLVGPIKNKNKIKNKILLIFASLENVGLLGQPRLLEPCSSSWSSLLLLAPAWSCMQCLHEPVSAG